jgi:polyisoprenoid-binding protein YceI
VHFFFTKNEQRDSHLKSPDVFDAAKFPKMSFASKSVSSVSDYELHVVGVLTMRDLTKEIALDVIHNGKVASFCGTVATGFETRTKAYRFDFGLQWNAFIEAGGVVVSN